MNISVKKVLNRPIIHQALDESLGTNINGPSLIEVPEWLPAPKGRFYLYFSHHEGKHIRMAFADHLGGPWHIHKAGALHLSQTPFPLSEPDIPQPAWAKNIGINGLYPHIASPDVHIDTVSQQLRMYFHGLDHDGEQRSLIATSSDGLNWSVDDRRIDPVYLRIFEHRSQTYALALGGEIFCRTSTGNFERGPSPFPQGHRHSAVLVRGYTLHVLWTRIGDAPEHILHSTINLNSDWRNWSVDSTRSLMFPDLEWEGADLPIEASRIGAAHRKEHALRDPCLLEQDGHVYMIYAGGGEQALGLAQVFGV